MITDAYLNAMDNKKIPSIHDGCAWLADSKSIQYHTVQYDDPRLRNSPVVYSAEEIDTYARERRKQLLLDSPITKGVVSMREVEKAQNEIVKHMNRILREHRHQLLLKNP
jgi:hypothetical protein